MTYILYTSNTCPKGIQAEQWLRTHNLSFEIRNLDDVKDAEAWNDALSATVDAVVVGKRDEAPEVSLPALTERMGANDERMVCVGFDSEWWEEAVLQKEST